MTHEQKINYMRIAAGIAGFGFTNEQLDLLISMYDLVLEKEGKAALDDMTDVEFDCRKREEERVKKELKEKKK